MTEAADDIAAPPSTLAMPRSAPLSRSAVGWALHQGLRDPYIILVVVYVFAPYFATVMVGDPVRGQALVASANTVAGWIVTLTAPLLGAVVDRLGPRKPGLALATLLMVPLIAALWWARPDGSGLSPFAVAAIIATVGVLFPYAEIHHNAMLPVAATPAEAPGASGLALSAGSALSVIVLLFVLTAFALPGSVDWPFVPERPLLGLDKAANEPDRVVAPIAAALMALSLLPILAWSRDAPRVGVTVGQAFADAVRQVRGLIGLLRSHRDAAIFLLSRMCYNDAMLALLALGGVFAAGVMRWGVLEMLAYGVLLSVFAVGGGFLGAAMDRALGPKRAVQVEVMGSLVSMIAILGMGREKILYAPFDPASVPPLWDGPVFRTLPEVIYLLLGFALAVFITGAFASSRTLLVRLAPTGQIGGFFGLYALSGAVTAWLAPMLVGVFTAAFGSQQAGFIPVAALLLIGLVGMLFVRGGGRASA